MSRRFQHALVYTIILLFDWGFSGWDGTPVADDEFNDISIFLSDFSETTFKKVTSGSKLKTPIWAYVLVSQIY